MRSLLISRYLPSEPEMVHGVFQRLGILVDALCSSSGLVDCLFLVPRGTDAGPARIADLQARLHQVWSSKIRLHIAPTLEFREGGPTRFERYVKASLSPNGVESVSPYLNDATCDAVTGFLGTRPDLVLAHRLQPMALLSTLPASSRDMPIIFDVDDIEHVAFWRRLLAKPGWPMERLRLVQVPMLAWCERRAMRAATCSLVCSETDRAYVSRVLGARNVEVLSNSVNIPEPGGGESGPVMLFVGSFGHQPNVAAAEWLIKEIWPSVRSQLPEAKLVLAGKTPEVIRGYAVDIPGVKFAGFVPDLAPCYARARVVCSPILSGSGVRFKILEAAAFGKAVVSTGIGAEGIDIDPGTEFVRADTTADFAAACVRLLRNASEAERIGRAAREKIISRYSRPAAVEQLRTIIDRCVRPSTDVAASPGSRGPVREKV